MAQFNEILVARYNSLFTRILGIKQQAPAPTLGPEVLPTFVTESDRPEHSFSKGERRVAGQINIAAGGATFYSSVRVRNPPLSGLLMTFTRATVIFPPGGGIVAGIGKVSTDRTVSSGTFGAMMDQRTQVLLSSAIGSADYAAGPLGSPFWRAYGPSAASTEFMAGNQFFPTAILPPGGALDFTMLFDNMELFVDLEWYERVLAPDELSGP